MDAARFDRMSKSFMTRTRRRTLLSGIAGATLVTLGLTRPAGADPKARLYSCCPSVGFCQEFTGTPQQAKDFEQDNDVKCQKFHLKVVKP